MQTLGFELFHDLRRMGSAARLDHDIEVGFLDRNVEKHALMHDFNDIAARVADHLAHPRQAARRIGDLDAQPHHLPVADQPTEQDLSLIHI